MNKLINFNSLVRIACGNTHLKLNHDKRNDATYRQSIVKTL